MWLDYRSLNFARFPAKPKSFNIFPQCRLSLIYESCWSVRLSSHEGLAPDYSTRLGVLRCSKKTSHDCSMAASKSSGESFLGLLRAMRCLRPLRLISKIEWAVECTCIFIAWLSEIYFQIAIEYLGRKRLIGSCVAILLTIRFPWVHFGSWEPRTAN